MPAIAPDHLLDPERRTIGDLHVGEECYMLAPAVRVDSKTHEVWLPTSEMAEVSPLTNRVIVRRQTDGYHVIVFEKGCKFRPEPLKLPEKDIAPVESIMEDYSREPKDWEERRRALAAHSSR